MKVEIRNRHIAVSLRRSSWVTACLSIQFNAALPPDGYRLVEELLWPRSKSGQAMNLRLTFLHVDKPKPMFDLDEAYEFFRREEVH